MNFLELPTYWWLDVALVLALLIEAFVKRRESWAIPAIGVYLTVAAWYLGDLAYSEPEEFYIFSAPLFDMALLQIALFLVCVRLLLFVAGFYVSTFKKVVPAREISGESLQALFKILITPWSVLFVTGLALAHWQIVAILWPPLADYKVGMFAHSGVGGSSDFLIAAAGYIYLAICALFGVGFTLSFGTLRGWYAVMMAIAWPYFFFDRNRTLMLAVCMPAVFAFTLLRREKMLKKVLIVGILALAINSWLLFVISTRGTEQGVAGSFEELFFGKDGNQSQGRRDSEGEEKRKHQGLDMLKELCYLDGYVSMGLYEPNWGRRYFAEIANVVPRAIWPGKPMIGIDYAMVRGYESAGDEEKTGVVATISTGMIGQGIANFGRFFGVISSAALMAAWILLLAKLWTQRASLLRGCLFLIGMGLTFNLGRDITLLVLWPFVFAYLGVRVTEKFFWPSDLNPELHLEEPCPE